jgi:putative membrane protein
MKRYAVCMVALCATVALACGERTTTTEETRTTESGAPATTTPAESGQTAAGQPASVSAEDRQFVEEMSRDNMAEVELGRLAAGRAASSEVKQFAQTMVDDHTKANAELKQVASQLNITLPGDIDQQHRDLTDRLSKLKGAEFDREYMKAMAEGHQQVVTELQAHAQPSAGMPSDRPGAPASGQPAGTAGTANNPVREWASRTLPTVRQHLERAQQINAKVSGSAATRP